MDGADGGDPVADMDIFTPTAPGVVLGTMAELTSHGVLVDKPEDGHEMGIVVDGLTPVAVMEQMTVMGIFVVVEHGIAARDFLDHFCDALFLFLDEQMHVVRHQTVGEQSAWQW